MRRGLGKKRQRHEHKQRDRRVFPRQETIEAMADVVLDHGPQLAPVIERRRGAICGALRRDPEAQEIRADAPHDERAGINGEGERQDGPRRARRQHDHEGPRRRGLIAFGHRVRHARDSMLVRT